MRYALLIALSFALVGCRTYNESTPRHYLEADGESNYRRIFRESAPREVTVVNSVVVAYSWRPGVVTTDDFEFELLVPTSWVAARKKQFHLQQGPALDVEQRKNRPIRSWYAPKSITEYDAYRDLTSVGYFHMLVEKTAEPDGRVRAFISKH